MLTSLKSLAGAACPLLLWHAGEFEGFSWFGGEDEKQLDKKAVASRSVMFQGDGGPSIQGCNVTYI